LLRRQWLWNWAGQFKREVVFIKQDNIFYLGKGHLK
jgi:hypothetical protein